MADSEKVEKLAEAIQQALYAGSNRSTWAKIKKYAEALVAAEEALMEYHAANRLHHDEDGRLYALSVAALAKFQAVMPKEEK